MAALIQWKYVSVRQMLRGSVNMIMKRAHDQSEICVGQKLLGMRKMDATFYCHFAIPVLKQEWQRGESRDSKM